MMTLNFVALGFALLPIVYLLAVAWPLARTDWRERRLPNALTLPGLWLALTAQTSASMLLGFDSISRGGEGWQGFANQMAALSVGFAVFASSLVAHVWAGLGMGDVKLVSVIALSLGWFSPWSPLLALFCGLATAVAWVLVGFVAGRTKLRSTLALGPWLLAGFVIAVAVLATDVSRFYSPGEVIDSTSSALSSWSSVSLTPST
jgi:leader peptidase (prepilin peptidase)/N-methyltransferase